LTVNPSPFAFIGHVQNLVDARHVEIAECGRGPRAWPRSPSSVIGPRRGIRSRNFDGPPKVMQTGSKVMPDDGIFADVKLKPRRGDLEGEPWIFPAGRSHVRVETTDLPKH
jgi:hypothetical protein